MEIYIGSIASFTESEYENAFNMMSAERQSAVARMRFENDRKRSVLGEWLVRKAVSDKFGIAEGEIHFGRGENGKPFCENLPVYFSIAHSKDRAVCAVSEDEIGADIEYIREIDMRVTRFACTEEDKEFLSAAKDDDEAQRRFFELWTAKEAYVKYLGTGISQLRDISYSDIKDNCESYTEDGYIITVYREK